MKKLKIENLEKISGGKFDWCLIAPSIFPPIVIGCIMRDIDKALGN